MAVPSYSLLRVVRGGFVPRLNSLSRRRGILRVHLCRRSLARPPGARSAARAHRSPPSASRAFPVCRCRVAPTTGPRSTSRPRVSVQRCGCALRGQAAGSGAERLFRAQRGLPLGASLVASVTPPLDYDTPPLSLPQTKDKLGVYVSRMYVCDARCVCVCVCVWLTLLLYSAANGGDARGHR
jgi:hypothetical protein